MAAPLMRIDLGRSTALPLCRGCGWRGTVHTGPTARDKATAEFTRHRQAFHATAAHDTGNKRRRREVVTL